MIIDAFKYKIFLLYPEGRFEGKDEDEGEIKDENGLIIYQMLDSPIFLKKETEMMNKLENTFKFKI